MPFDKTKLWVLDSRRPIAESSRGHTRIFQTADLLRPVELTEADPPATPRSSVTRIMPIEQLLALPPTQNTTTIVDEAQQLEQSLRAVPTSRATQLRRVFALSALMLTGALQLLEPSSPTRPRAQRAVASAPVAMTTVEPTLVPAIEAPQVASPPEKKRRHRLATPAARDPLQRAAVDAVAAGDYRRAVSTYDQLAAREPTQLAYHEAARILRLRLSTRAR